MAEVEIKPEYTFEIWFAGIKYLSGVIIGREETMIAELFTFSKAYFGQFELATLQEFKIIFKRTK